MAISGMATSAFESDESDEIMADGLILPSNFKETNASLYSVEYNEVNGKGEYTLKSKMPNAEGISWNMDGTGNDVLRKATTDRMNKLIQLNPGMVKDPKFSVSAGFSQQGGYHGRIKVIFDIDKTKKSKLTKIDSYGFFAGGKDCKSVVNGKYGNPYNIWKNNVMAKNKGAVVSFPQYGISQPDPTSPVTSIYGLGASKYTKLQQTYAYYSLNFATIEGEAQKEVKQKRAPYPNRENKYNNTKYENLTWGEKAFFDEVAKRVPTMGYTKQVDGGIENKKARGKLDTIFLEMKKYGYEMKISSGYRSPQKQFSTFFKNNTINYANGVKCFPIKNFLPPSIVNGAGKPKPGYEAQYNEILADYVKRAQYVAPPGYSEHQTGEAFDFKINNINTGIETLMGDVQYGDPIAFQRAKSLLEKNGFKNTYQKEPWHRKFSN